MPAPLVPVVSVVSVVPVMSVVAVVSVVSVSSEMSFMPAVEISAERRRGGYAPEDCSQDERDRDLADFRNKLSGQFIRGSHSAPPL